MNRSRWVVSCLIVFALGLAGGVTSAKQSKETQAKGGKKGKVASAEGGGAAPPGVAVNACGCYQKGSGCACTTKKLICECPGECEPVGCAEKRDKELQKEADQAVKQAQQEDKKREDAERARAEEQQKEEQKKAEAVEEANAPEATAGDGDKDKPAAQADDQPAPEEKAAPKSKAHKAAKK